MPDAVATLSESAPGAMAIRTARSAAALVAGASPCPSDPSKKAIRARTRGSCETDARMTGMTGNGESHDTVMHAAAVAPRGLCASW